jgi:hypothetical protein
MVYPLFCAGCLELAVDPVTSMPCEANASAWGPALMLAESIAEMGAASSNMLQICSLELLWLTYLLLSNPTVLLLASGISAQVFHVRVWKGEQRSSLVAYGLRWTLHPFTGVNKECLQTMEICVELKNGLGGCMMLVHARYQICATWCRGRRKYVRFVSSHDWRWLLHLGSSSQLALYSTSSNNL